MKKIILLFSIILFAITSCTIEPSNNGDLDGYWCLCQIDSLYNNTSIDYRQQRVFWAFQNKLMQTQQFDGKNEIYIYRFNHEGNTLKVSNPYLSERVQGDRMITEDSLFVLKPHGVNTINETFTVEELTGSEMILKDDVLRLHFTKY